MAVGAGKSAPNLEFYLQYPTKACGWSNPAVRSPWDNEPTPVGVVAEPRGEAITASIEAVRAQGLDGMATIWESLINAVNCSKPKMLTGLDQKVSGRVRGLVPSPSWTE